MGFVSCLEDQQKRFESDCHMLQRDIRSRRMVNPQKRMLYARSAMLRCWAKMLKYMDELTLPDFGLGMGLREQCSELKF